MRIKLSPMAQYSIVFWIFTILLMPVIIVLALLVVINPIRREVFIDWVEEAVTRMTICRNNLPIVKYYYDKAHLFDTLRKL